MCYTNTTVDTEWLKKTAEEILEGKITMNDAAQNVQLINGNGEKFLKSVTPKTLSNYFKENNIVVFKVGRKGFSKENRILEKLVIDNYYILRCGVTKMWCYLVNEGINCSRNDVEKIYNKNIRAIKPKEEKSIQIPRCRYECVHVNSVWHGDIHYIKFQNEIRYLFVLMDDKSRFIVSYGMSKFKTTSFVISVFDEAIDYYEVTPFYYWSDNGRENTSKEMQRYLSDIGTKHIRTMPHNPQQNGKMERWWRELEKRLTNALSWTDLYEKIDDFVDIYNNKLPHSGLSYNGRMCAPIKIFSDEKLQAKDIKNEMIIVDGKVS